MVWESKTLMRMQIQLNPSNLIRFSATPVATLLLLAIAIPNQPAWATHRNNFQHCAAQLLRFGIGAPVAADACAAALYPKDLSICVTGIAEYTNIAAADALATCRQVRRPRDLGKCVVTISTGTQNASPPDILDNCRRSLLPLRFADCVVGLNREVDYSPTKVMATCIDGSDRPQDFYPPSFAPRQNLQLPNRLIPVPQFTLPVAPTEGPMLR